MIIVYVNSQTDTDTFSRLYEGMEGSTLLYNPTRQEVEKVLSERPEERVMLFGHGSAFGLMNEDLSGYLIDKDTLPLLKTREVIGIWCYASEFAQRNELTGFFTYMFISNPMEAYTLGFAPYEEEVVFDENRKFAAGVRGLIEEGVSLDQWPYMLLDGCNEELDFVLFNYANLVYLDGE